ncbi:LysR family transcriptional regulator [uncultured Roseibium sp.]|uniref:LysR family transcriptional regulator n=1 Tax=uncultured Roseibium sp. TaxID=1936171 RepID=UPI0026356672|nr:LysR family transcriptional regulator [uncultured Roseibium sp.]
MSQHSDIKDLSLKGLELFQLCARRGSLQAVAAETGLSASTVSHHLRSLEETLRVDLFDHSRRPLILTQKGKIFLRDIEDALHTLRRAKAEAAAGNMSEASYLRLGTIEDFDSDIIPALAVSLFESMPNCDFVYHTDSSLTIVQMLRNRQLDVGVSATPSERLGDLIDRPLLRDPFVMVVPKTVELLPRDIIHDSAELPFLRFSSNLIIARQIEAQLRRMDISPPHRFECGNNQTLMAMVAAGTGWTITTPLLFSRARRFHEHVEMHRFPGKGFARTLAVLANADCSRSVLNLVDSTIRSLIADTVVKPFHETAPWLKESFQLIE